MKASIISVLAVFICVALVHGADMRYGEKVKLYVESYGKRFAPMTVVLSGDAYSITLPDGVPTFTESDLTEEAVLDLPAHARKLVGHKYVAKTAEELLSEDLAANGGIYAYQNAFLLLCDAAKGTNTHEKLAFETLPRILKAIKKGGDKAKFDDLRDAFNTINQALIKKAGINWWDTCAWNTNATVLANGQAIYDGLMAP